MTPLLPLRGLPMIAAAALVAITLGALSPVAAQPVPGPIGAPPAGQCIRRTTDERPAAIAQDKTLQVWVSVETAGTAIASAYGEAEGKALGGFDITIMQDGLISARSDEERGAGILSAKTSATLALQPGRQYRVTVKPRATSKQVRKVGLQIAINGGCA